MPATRIFPLDAQGQRSDRGPQEVIWTLMENIIVRDGFLQPRPGLVEINSDFRHRRIPDTVEHGVPVAIMEIENPGEDNAGREGYKYIIETLRPTSDTQIVAGWSGTYADIDDVTLDGNTMDCSTVGGQESIGFGNITKDFDRIDCIYLRGIVDLSGESMGAPYNVSLNLYARISGTNYLVGTADIISLETDSSDRIQFGIAVPNNPSITDLTKRQWTAAKVNALEIVMELGSGSTQFALRVLPDADGINTDGGTYTDFDAPTPGYTGVPDPKNSVDSGITLTAGQKQGWTFATFPDYDGGLGNATLDSFYLFIGFDGNTWDDPSVVKINYYPTAGVAGTVYTLATKTFSFEGSQDETYPFLAELISGNNPDTGVAWTESDITAGEFELEIVSGETKLISANMLAVMDSTEVVKVEVDQLALDVYGMDADEDADNVVLGYSPLWSTNFGHYRWDGYSGNFVTITDVTNSVPFTTPPTQFIDQAILYGQVYEVNGTDATRRYPGEAGTNLYEALTANNADGSTKITGRTVAAFADRILYGWVTDNTTVTPERIAYSKEFDGGTHNDISAGDFDLIDTPGGVLKLLQLNEDVCTAYKTNGIYMLRRTGFARAPIIRDVIDFQTGLIAPATAKNVLGPDRDPVQLFLGRNPVDGFNVFMFNGAMIAPVGDGIKKELRDEIDHEFIGSSFAFIDNNAGYYYLALPFRGTVFPEAGFMLNLRTMQWQKFTLPFGVTCGGTWTLPNLADLRLPARFGYPTSIVAGFDGLPRRLEHGITHDSLKPALADPTTADEARRRYDFTHGDLNDARGGYPEYFDCTLESGDLLLAADQPHVSSALRSIHLQYRDVGVTKVTAYGSIDGGINWEESSSFQLGTHAADGQLRYQHMDFTEPVHGRRHRIKLVFSWDLDGDLDYIQFGDYPFKIEEIWLDFEPGGEDI